MCVQTLLVLRLRRVGKKWEPRNPVHGPFAAKIWKVDWKSESSPKKGKLSQKIGRPGVRPKKRALTYFGLENYESLEKFGKFIQKIRKTHPEN